MTGLLQRYVLRETLQTWLVVTLVLLLILVTNQFASVLGDAAASKLPRDGHPAGARPHDASSTSPF